MKYKIDIAYDNVLNDLILNNSNTISLVACHLSLVTCHFVYRISYIVYRISYIIEFAADESVYSILDLTFKKILLAVYQKIINYKHKLEILIILAEEMFTCYFVYRI